MDELEIEIPQYFLCPISLQIMKDPVTTITGITYDRENIQQWLIMAAEDSSSAAAAVCPVTKQPLSRALDLTPNHMPVKTQTLSVLKNITEFGSSNLMERLNPSFFEQMVKLLRQEKKTILHILIQTCRLARNKTKIVEAGAVLELIEMELTNQDKRTTELIFFLLAHLCSCSDGWQELLKHAGGVAVVAKRLLRVSPATDDRALCILESIARFSATRGLVMEMLTVGGVSKICMVLQADCEVYLKRKAREILRLHNNAWSNSPCIQVYLLTRYTR